MSVMKYTTKYLLYSLICVIVFITTFSIGSLIHSQRNAKETLQVSPSEIDAQTFVSQLSPKRSSSDEHFHADAAHPVIRNNNRPVSKKEFTPSHSISHPSDGNANKSSLGWITWKYGHTSGRSRSPGKRHYDLLPEEIAYEIRLLEREQNARKSLQGEEIDLNDRHPVLGLNRVEMVGRQRNIPDPMSILLDKRGDPLPPFTESEYAEEELRRLVGDRDIEEAAQFLEQHGHYNTLLLSRLSDERAFDYLYSISSPNGSGVPDGSVRMYAERVVARDPAHLKARLYLADT